MGLKGDFNSLRFNPGRFDPEIVIAQTDLDGQLAQLKQLQNGKKIKNHRDLARLQFDQALKRYFGFAPDKINDVFFLL